MNGMLFSASTVAISMLACSSDDTCGTPGFDVIEEADEIESVEVSDVACQNVTPQCQQTDDAGSCSTFYVDPIAQGNCHVDVVLVKGTTFSTDVKILAGPGSCSKLFFPAAIGDNMIEVP